MNLTPEQRKRIAEWAGREIVGDSLVDVYVRNSDDLFEEYTPDTNDAQAFEMLERLESYEGYLTIGTFDDNPEMKYVELVQGAYEGQTLNLAICHAILAILDNTENDNV